MIRKRKTALGFICLSSLLLAGCQQTPESPIVVQKKEVSQAETVKIEEDNQIGEEIAAPETYQTEFADAQGITKVKVDAKVVMPDMPGFKLKKVTGRLFTQEEADKLLHVLGEDAPLWNASSMTKTEIEDAILDMEKDKNEGKYDGEEGAQIIDSMKNEFEKMYETAPETPETEITKVVLGQAYTGVWGENPGNNFLGTMTVDKKDYFFELSNDWREDWKWIRVKMQPNGKNYMGGAYNLELIDTSQVTTPTRELEEQAKQLIKELGISDLELYGTEYYESLTYVSGEGEETAERPPSEWGYGMHFTRVVDGIPLTYTQDNGGSSPDGPETPPEEANIPWSYENLEVVYDKDGLGLFHWVNPYEISDLSSEYVKLMPFADIQKIFEQMILTKGAQYSTPEMEIKTEYIINEVKLGYMRVMEKGSPEVGTLIPVWDFFGSEIRHVPAMPEYSVDAETSVINGKYYSWLTINAMDGTIIDRSFGY